MKKRLLFLLLSLSPFFTLSLPSEASAANGTLVVVTQETGNNQIDASIHVDGALAGTGKISLSLAPGTHLVEFGNVDGYAIVSPRSGKKNVQVTSGKKTSLKATYKKSSTSAGGGGNGGTGLTASTNMQPFTEGYEWVLNTSYSSSGSSTWSGTTYSSSMVCGGTATEKATGTDTTSFPGKTADVIESQTSEKCTTKTTGQPDSTSPSSFRSRSYYETTSAGDVYYIGHSYYSGNKWSDPAAAENPHLSLKNGASTWKSSFTIDGGAYTQTYDITAKTVARENVTTAAGVFTNALKITHSTSNVKCKANPGYTVNACAFDSVSTAWYIENVGVVKSTYTGNYTIDYVDPQGNVSKSDGSYSGKSELKSRNF